MKENKNKKKIIILIIIAVVIVILLTIAGVLLFKSKNNSLSNKNYNATVGSDDLVKSIYMKDDSNSQVYYAKYEGNKTYTLKVPSNFSSGRVIVMTRNSNDSITYEGRTAKANLGFTFSSSTVKGKNYTAVKHIYVKSASKTGYGKNYTLNITNYESTKKSSVSSSAQSNSAISSIISNIYIQSNGWTYYGTFHGTSYTIKLPSNVTSGNLHITFKNKGYTVKVPQTTSYTFKPGQTKTVQIKIQSSNGTTYSTRLEIISNANKS